jgi:hypothetical protein
LSKFVSQDLKHKDDQMVEMKGARPRFPNGYNTSARRVQQLQQQIAQMNADKVVAATVVNAPLTTPTDLNDMGGHMPAHLQAMISQSVAQIFAGIMPPGSGGVAARMTGSPSFGHGSQFDSEFQRTQPGSGGRDGGGNEKVVDDPASDTLKADVAKLRHQLAAEKMKRVRAEGMVQGLGGEVTAGGPAKKKRAKKKEKKGKGGMSDDGSESSTES